MMAVVADTLIAAPFATVGSIGATTSVPILNVGGFLKRVGIQAYTVKSGKLSLLPCIPPSFPLSLSVLIAAPFASVGSIGATPSVPILNVGGFLKRVGIQAYTVKSGKLSLLPASLPPSSLLVIRFKRCVNWV